MRDDHHRVLARASFGIAFLAAAAFAVSALSPSPAHAFGLEDHRRIMRAAIGELNACLAGRKGEAIPAIDRDVLLDAVVLEDMDYATKIFNCHYYNPVSPLRSWRVSSHDRVIRLEQWIEGERGEPAARLLWLVNLGRVAHQIEDMASPPHVMPIRHGLGDGIESFSTGEIPPSADCESFRQPLASLHELHREIALETYRRVTEPPAPGATDWSRFWLPGTQGAFGHYGEAGNVFGKADFRSADGDRAVGHEQYVLFKQAQLRLAVEATKRMLYHTVISPTPARAP